eukprot:5657533-Prorocentrum_lima.AAC.1
MGTSSEVPDAGRESEALAIQLSHLKRLQANPSISDGVRAALDIDIADAIERMQRSRPPAARLAAI